jgi:hypothetical protein
MENPKNGWLRSGILANIRKIKYGLKAWSSSTLESSKYSKLSPPCRVQVHGFSRLHGDWLMDPPGKFTQNWDFTSKNHGILGYTLSGYYGKWPIEIDGLPFLKMLLFHGYVSHNQMVIQML